MRFLAKIQFIVLLIGVVFTFGTWVGDLMKWLERDGQEVIGNPFISIEFLTLVLFLLAFILNVFIWIGVGRKAKKEEKMIDVEEDESDDMMEEVEEE